MASAEREAAVTAEGGGCIVGDSGDGVDRQQQQRPGRQRGQKQRRRWGQTTINQNAVAIVEAINTVQNSAGQDYLALPFVLVWYHTLYGIGAAPVKWAKIW
jgi:hypothetical protein